MQVTSSYQNSPKEASPEEARVQKKQARRSYLDDLNAVKKDKVQGICSALQESGVLSVEEAITALVKKAFQIRRIEQKSKSLHSAAQSTDPLLPQVHKVEKYALICAAAKITFVLSKRFVDFDSHIVTCSEEIPSLEEKAQTIHNYIVANKDLFCTQAKESDEDVYVRPAGSELPRALLFTKTGKVFVLLNRTKEGDSVLSESCEKRITMAMNLATAQLFVSASFKDGCNREIVFLKKFQGIDGIVQMHHSVSYPKKIDDQSSKIRAILEFYNEGDLWTKVALEQIQFNSSKIRPTGLVSVMEEIGGMTLEDKKQITEDLIKALAFLHKEGYAHRDVKLENILLLRKGGVLRAFLGDLDYLWHKDQGGLNTLSGTLNWVSPEMAEFLCSDADSRGLFNFDQMQATDVWALGLALRWLFERFHCRWMMKGNKHQGQILLMIKNHCEWTEPPHQNSPVHFAWQMMRKNPKERISAQEALRQLPLLEWSEPSITQGIKGIAICN